MVLKCSNNLKENSYGLMKIASYISSMFLFLFYLYISYKNDKTILWAWDTSNIPFLNKIIKNIDITPSLICIILFSIEIISILYVVYFFKLKIKKVHEYNTVTVGNGVIQNKSNTSNYLLANVLPIITIELDEIYKGYFVLVLVVILGFMYIKNDLYYINPLYDLMNIKVYEGQLNPIIAMKDNKPINKPIISTINLYTFRTSKYHCIEGRDTVIVVKKLE